MDAFRNDAARIVVMTMLTIVCTGNITTRLSIERTFHQWKTTLNQTHRV